MVDRSLPYPPASRLEFSPLIEDLLDVFEPFVDPKREDWRQLLGELLRGVVGTPLLSEGDTYTRAYCHSLEARLTKLEELVKQLYRLVWTGQVTEPGGPQVNSDNSEDLHEIGRDPSFALRKSR